MRPDNKFWKQLRLTEGPQGEFWYEADDVGMSICWRPDSTRKDLATYLRQLANRIEDHRITRELPIVHPENER